MSFRRASRNALLRPVLLLFLAVSLLPLPMGRVAADPIVTDNLNGTSVAVWNFTNPANYSLTNTRIAGGIVSLPRMTGWWNSTTPADFSGPDSSSNVTWTQWPGDVALSRTAGPSTLLSLQPGAVGEDTWLDRANPAMNHGGDTTLVLDGLNPQSYPLLRFNLSTIPANVLIDNVSLNLYESAGIGNPVTGRLHLVTSQWVENQATWNNRITGTAWTTAGGDFNGKIIDQQTIDNTVTWRTWNATVLVDLWYRGRVPNYGLILEAPTPGANSDKTFWSSDYTVDPTRRPRLDVWYRALGVAGNYVSKVGGPGTQATWQTIAWNSTDRSLLSDEFNGASLDPKWTWTNPPTAFDVGTTTPGSLHVVSSTGSDFFGAAFSGNVLANEVVGNFTATMKYTTTPTVNGQKTGLMALLGPRDWYGVQKQYVGATTSVNWRVRATVDSVTTTRVDVVSANPNPAWIRIQRAGTTFTAYTSPDGTTWTLQDTYTPAFEYPLQVRLAFYAADGVSGTAVVADVDYIRVVHDRDALSTVQTRTGNVSPVDGTWTAWSAAYPAPTGSAMAGSSRYVESRLGLSVTYPDHTPDIADVNISWTRYVASGTVETNDLAPSSLAAWGNVTTVQALSGQTITFEYSLNSGGSWSPVSPPADLSGVPTASGRIRFRATLSTADTTVTPTLSEIRLTYTHRVDHFYVTAPTVAAAGSPFTVTVTVKDTGNSTIVGWRGTVALQARLSDGVTPGGAILGTTTLVITSGGTGILASETYAKAETIRIYASNLTATGLSGNIRVSRGAVSRIAVAPGSVSLLPSDIQNFAAQAFDAWNNSVPGLTFNWTVVGGVGSLNASTGSGVRFTANPPPASGSLRAAFGAVVGVAQIQVVSGILPWVRISAPAAGARLAGSVLIRYTNSPDAVSLRFEYNNGSGWTLIGTTATLNGTYPWNTSGINFTAGSLRATVANNRTITNTTVISPIDVDNRPTTTVVEPTWWKNGYMFAVPPIGILAVIAVFARRARWRPAKAFLVDDGNRMLREFTLDPSCEVTYEEAVKAGALDALEKPVKVQKFHAQTVRGDALGVVLLAVGPVTAQQIEFAREMLVNIQDKFEAAVKERLDWARAAEAGLEDRQVSLDAGEKSLAARSAAFAGALDAAILAQSKITAEVAAIRDQSTDLEQREGRLKETQERVTRETEEVERVRGTLKAREEEVSERETEAAEKATMLAGRESQIQPLEEELREREASVSLREEQIDQQSQALTAKVLEVSQARKNLEEREAKLAREKDLLEKAREDLDPQVREFEARVGRFEEDSERTRGELDGRGKALEAEEARVATERGQFEAMREEKSLWITQRESELAETQVSLHRREEGLGKQSEALRSKDLELSALNKELTSKEASLARDRAELEKARTAFEPERRAFHDGVARFEKDSERVRQELEGRGKTLDAEQTRLASEREQFETVREEKSLWIARRESEIEEADEGLRAREGTLRTQSDGLEKKALELAAMDKDLGSRRSALESDRSELAKARAVFEPERRSLEERTARFDQESRTRKEDLDDRTRILGEEQMKFATARQSFEAMRTERSQWIATKEIELEAKEQSLSEKEKAVRSQAEENARHLADLASREEALEIEADKAEKTRAAFEARQGDLDRLAKGLDDKAVDLRELEARKGEEFRAWQATHESQTALLRQEREAFETDAQEGKEQWAMRKLQLEQQEEDLVERETKVRGGAESVARAEEDVKRREVAAQEAESSAQDALARAAAAEKEITQHTFELERRERTLREEAAKITDELARRGQAMRNGEADLVSRRTKYEQDAAALQERIRAAEADLSRRGREADARAKDLSEREARTAALQSTLKEQEERLARETQDFATATRQLEARQVEADQIAERNMAESNRIQGEAEAMRKTLAAKEAELRSERERLERESNGLQDRLGAKAQELAARERTLAAKEAEAVQASQKFEADKATWAVTRSGELKQLETTQQAVAEQSQRAEKLLEESQRRAYLASEAEATAKRQTDDLVAQQAQAESRRVAAEKAERAAETQTAQLNEATRRLASKEMEVNTLTKELKEREARLAAAAQEANRAAEELRARKSALDQENSRLGGLARDLESRRLTLDAHETAIEGKAAELVQREGVLTTELQRAENLMEDLGGKEAELKSREKALAEGQKQLAVWEDEVAQREVEAKQGMESLDRLRKETETRLAEADRDRSAAAKARDEAIALKTDAERVRAQSEAMQQEVQKSTKFLQKKAVETLDREEKVRRKEEALGERENELETRAEILESKEKTLEVDQEEMNTKLERLQADIGRLKGKLAEAEKSAGTSKEMEEWRQDLDARVKIVQKKAFDLLDREEKLRKREENLKALAERLGVKP